MPKYLGLIVWGTVLRQYLYRLEENDMTVKLISRNFTPLKYEVRNLSEKFQIRHIKLLFYGQWEDGLY